MHLFAFLIWGWLVIPYNKQTLFSEGSCRISDELCPSLYAGCYGGLTIIMKIYSKQNLASHHTKCLVTQNTPLHSLMEIAFYWSNKLHPFCAQRQLIKVCLWWQLASTKKQHSQRQDNDIWAWYTVHFNITRQLSRKTQTLITLASS
jgi:hypothetical protein